METIPPTQDAFLQHCRRAAYQAGIWSTSDRAHQELPSPEGYGWTLNTERKWSPVWTTLPVASKACTELVRCGCKSDRQSGNALNFAAATVKRNRCTDCIGHDVHFIFIIYIFTTRMEFYNFSQR